KPSAPPDNWKRLGCEPEDTRDGASRDLCRLPAKVLADLDLGRPVAGVLTILLTWGFVDRAHATVDTTRCRPQPAPTGQLATVVKQPAQLKPRVEPKATVAFYQDRDVTMRRVEYDITDPGNVLSGATVLDVSVGPFLSTANSRQLEPRDINASARVERNRVIIDVCFNRTDPHFGSPAPTPVWSRSPIPGSHSPTSPSP